MESLVFYEVQRNIFITVKSTAIAMVTAKVTRQPLYSSGESQCGCIIEHGRDRILQIWRQLVHYSSSSVQFTCVFFQKF